MKQVTMRHADLETEITVSESAVPFHMASGWVPVDDVTASPAASKPKAPAPAKDKE